ncbi:MAG: hypothetical protein R3E08_11900 [Thiotrichaceae bacterium]
MTKSDKLSYGKGMNVVSDVAQQLTQFSNTITLQRFSSLKRRA